MCDVNTANKVQEWHIGNRIMSHVVTFPCFYVRHVVAPLKGRWPSPHFSANFQGCNQKTFTNYSD